MGTQGTQLIFDTIGQRAGGGKDIRKLSTKELSQRGLTRTGGGPNPNDAPAPAAGGRKKAARQVAVSSNKPKRQRGPTRSGISIN
jgi:hypothetical protein